MSRGSEFSLGSLMSRYLVQQPCSFCGGTPARNGSIYTWAEALGFQLCEACSSWEIENAHPEYIAALGRDNDSASGEIGAKDAWLDTVIGQNERRAWAKGNGNGKAGSRSRSPRRFEDIAQRRNNIDI